MRRGQAPYDTDVEIGPITAVIVGIICMIPGIITLWLFPDVMWIAWPSVVWIAVILIASASAVSRGLA